MLYTGGGSVTGIANQSITLELLISYVVKLGESGGMPLRKILKITCSEIDFGGVIRKK